MDETLDASTERTLNDLTEVLSEETRYGIRDASTRLANTRAGLTNKIRDLEKELERRAERTTPGEHQLALTLIAQLARNLEEAVKTPQSIENKMTAARKICSAFEKRLLRLLEASGAWEEEAAIDATAERV